VKFSPDTVISQSFGSLWGFCDLPSYLTLITSRSHSRFLDSLFANSKFPVFDDDTTSSFLITSFCDLGSLANIFILWNEFCDSLQLIWLSIFLYFGDEIYILYSYDYIWLHTRVAELSPSYLLYAFLLFT